MPRIRPQYRRALQLGVAGLAAAAVLTGNSGLALADAGYGPPPPTAPVPGGYFRVVTSQTIGTAGGTIGPLGVDGLAVTLRIPRHAFARSVQITLTEPDVRGIGNAGFRGYRAFGGVGILIQIDGSTYRGPFRKPLGLTMSSRRVTSADIVVVWDGTRFVSLRTRDSFHSDSVRFDSAADEDFAILRAVGIVVTRKAAKGARGTFTAATTSYLIDPAVLAEAFLVPAGSPLPGLGVRTSGSLRAPR
jgi:hypothetical protein